MQPIVARRVGVLMCYRRREVHMCVLSCSPETPSRKAFNAGTNVRCGKSWREERAVDSDETLSLPGKCLAQFGPRRRHSRSCNVAERHSHSHRVSEYGEQQVTSALHWHTASPPSVVCTSVLLPSTAKSSGFLALPSVTCAGNTLHTT